MSFIRILNKMGPNIEPCGIPDKSIWKTLSVSFIFTSCFLHFKMVRVVNTKLVFLWTDFIII